MKLTLLFLFTFLQAKANITGQVITLSKKEVAITSVFLEIQKQTDYNFFFKSSWFTESKPVSIEVKNASIEEVLSLILKGLPYQYKIVGKSIIIQPKQSPTRSLTESSSAPIDIKGKVINEKGEAIAGASVTVKGTSITVPTDNNGEFSLPGVDEKATIVITSVNFETKEIRVNGRSDISVSLSPKITELQTVEVSISNGYQTLSPERTTGSYSTVNNQLLNRRISRGIVDRIENLTTGVLFNHGDAPDPILIRGRSSIFSNVSPLIVVDNFPYDGNINNINPNDVENVTILKDAAAASIWGARAGNGVIVITTKRGKTTKPQISFNSNITIQEKPDLYNIPIISSSDYIELEKFLFDKGYYNNDYQNQAANGYKPFTPVVELLFAKKNGTISASVADEQINNLKKIDARSDLEKYFYQTGINLQNALNISGNSAFINYYFSVGWDKNRSNLVSQNNNRLSLRSQNIFKVTPNLELQAGLTYIQSTYNSGNNPGIGLRNSGKGLYPYADLVDNNGNALAFAKDYRSGYTDTAGQGKLLNWKYRPYEDIYNTENISKNNDFIVNAGLRYRFSDHLNAEVRYQLENSVDNNSVLNKIESYNTRNLINSFTQVAVDGTLTYPIPKGGIMSYNNSQFTSHQGRLQLNYNQLFKGKHLISALAGWEIKNLSSKSANTTVYGYSRTGSIVYPGMDFVTRFKQYYNLSSTSTIPNSQSISETLDRFISYFGNVSYTYDNRYTISGSARNDAANLFGVKTNQKGVPLWSIGGSWMVSNEQFYNAKWISNLKLRATYGVNGNFSRVTSALTTARYSPSSATQLLSAQILNPPNDKLRWEQVRMLDLGIDFATRNNRISGTFDFYQKNAKDLMGQAPVDPTLGVGTTLFLNVASMKGTGYELNLNTINVAKKFSWQSNFLFSYSRTKVTEYLMPVSTLGKDYVGLDIKPLIGKPIYGLYSYHWGGLDNTTGDPLGYLGKDVSKNYSSIINNTKLDSMLYNGPSQPTYYGAFRNTFAYKNLSLSINISYKMAYYFKRSSISYSSLISNWSGHGDYARRWQKAGDEKNTSVPSFVYPADLSRDAFYLNSATLIEKADNIRLEDINLNYTLNKATFHKLPFKQISIYAYSNLGIVLWKANDKDIDPFYNGIERQGKSIALGLNINF